MQTYIRSSTKVRRSCELSFGTKSRSRPLSHKTGYEQAYEDDRFDHAVSQNFHCPICFNVLNDAIMCRRNQHCFCRPCITRYLKNSQTCPTCMEELTIETLTQVPRIFKVCWSELNIRCDHFNRGCQEFVQLGDLQTHVKNCGFSPVVCSNEGCLEEINKWDRTRHETEVCPFRKVKCNDCSELRKDMDEMKIELIAVKYNLQEMQMNFKTANNEVRTMVGNIRVAIDKMKTDIMTALKNEVKENIAVMNTETKVNSKAVNDKLDEIKIELQTLQDQTVRGIQTKKEKMKNEIAEAEIYAMGNNGIIIAGGFPVPTVEMFDWSRRKWSPLQPLKQPRDSASSFVFRNQMIVTGGFVGCTLTDTMESVSINPVMNSRPWLELLAKLPTELHGHSCVVHDERLIVIGGYDGKKCCAHDNIDEVCILPPYASALLTRMPQARGDHCAQLFHDKILICGGRETLSYRDSLDSVIMYDIDKNECKQMAPLPYAVSEMATVSCGGYVILIGGADEKNNPLNTVVIYNVRTEKSYILSAMKCKRKGCEAVMIGNSIVVMGGEDERGNYLNSVESFSFDRNSWEDLPPMKEARLWATAVAW